MNNITKRILAFLLSFMLIISSGGLISLFGKNAAKFAGNAKAEGEVENSSTRPEGVPSEYKEYDLYNFIHVNGTGDNGFGRLRKTIIYTKDTMDVYALSAVSDAYLIPEGEFVYEPEEYDFSTENNRVLSLKGTKGNLNKYDGNYLLFDYYLNELKNGNNINLSEYGESGLKIDGFFIVEGPERSPRFFKNKLGGSGFGWVYPDLVGQSDASRPSFHRDYLIDLSEKGVYPVYNLLGVTGRGVTGHDNKNYFRLSDRAKAITLPFLFNCDTVVGKKKTIDPSGEYYRVLLPEKDDFKFSNLVLHFTIENIDYDFLYQPDSNYAPDSTTFAPYYTVELEGISFADSIHGSSPSWYGEEDGWLGNPEHPEWPESNATPSYHRDYKATLHREGDKHRIKFYNSEEKNSSTLIDNREQIIGNKTTFGGSTLPTKESDDEYFYVFSGWKNSQGVVYNYSDSNNNDLPNVGRNEEYTPVFTAYSKSITITAASDEWTYDGSAHSNTAVTVTSGSLLEGDELVATATGSVTNVAETSDGNNPVADGYRIMRGEEDVTANYAITVENGTLTINPKALIITAQDKAFTYDGTAQSWPKYDVVGLVGSDAVSAVVSGTITFPNESPVANVLTSYEFTTGTPGNYSVTTANGQLTMSNASIAITITSASQEWTYDGSAHSNNTVTVTSGTLLEGDELVATATGSVTNVSDTVDGNNLIADGYKIMHGENDVTANYAITVVNGTLTIKKRSVTLTSESDDKPYDGTPLTKPAVTVGGDGFVDGEVTDIMATGSVTTVAEGVVTNTITYTSGESFNAENYTITKNEGKLHISPSVKALVITSSTKSWEYDGQTHKDEVYSVSYDGSSIAGSSDGAVYTFTLPTGDKITITPTSGGVIDYSSEGVTNNYIYALENPDCYDNVTSNKGNLSITKRPITLTANNASNEYTGSDITYASASDAVSPYYSINDGSLAEGQSITSIVLNGSGKTVGVYDIDISSVQIGDYTANYDITFVPGKLTISKNTTEITVVPGNGSKMYDGTPLTKNEHEDFTVTGVPEGFTWTAVADGTVTNVVPGEGEKAVNAVTEFKIFDAEGNDVTDQFDNIDTSATGTLTITPRSVTLTSESGEKPYDGTPLTKPDVTVGGDGFVEGEVTDIKASGSVTTVAEGEVANTITYTAGESFKEDNYSITKNEGNLKITRCAKALVITSSTKEFPYDGETHKDEVYTVSFDGIAVEADSTGKVFTLPTGDTLTITATAEGVKDYSAEYSENNTFTYELVNSACYSSVTEKSGTLTIAPKEATLEWSDTEFPYDGESHAPTAAVSNLIDGDECEVTVTGEKTEAGEDYVATATELSNSNYKLPEKNTTTFSIYGCVVIFKNEDGTVLSKQGVPFGTKPVYNGDEPTKEATAQYTYVFDGWTPEIVEVEAKETVYTATYQQNIRTYTVEPSDLPDGVKLSITDKKTVDAGADITFTISVEKGYDKSESFAVKANGKILTPDEDGNYKLSGILEDVKITVSGVEKVSYNVADGDKTKHVLGDKKDAKFVFKRNVNDAETFGRNTAILLDGKEMAAGQFVKSSGSLIVELKADFMDTLSVGEHILTVRFDDYDEDVKATLIIEKAADPAPTTGDTGNLTLWIVIGVVSLVVFLALFLLICKRRREEEDI